MSAVLFDCRYELNDGVIREDGSATFDFELRDRETGELVDLGPDSRQPNRGTWIMLDVSPN